MVAGRHEVGSGLYRDITQRLIPLHSRTSLKVVLFVGLLQIKVSPLIIKAQFLGELINEYSILFGGPIGITEVMMNMADSQF